MHASFQEEWDRYVELGLTGYVKCGSYQIIEEFPDGLVLLSGKLWPTVAIGSRIEALVNDGNLENLDYYIMQNERSRARGFVNKFFDMTLGQWEDMCALAISTYDKLQAQPSEYVYDTFTGHNPDKGWKKGVKVSLSLIQMFTKYPVYTAAQQTEKDVTQMMEAYHQFMEMMPQTPEAWKSVIENVVTNMCTGAEEAGEALKQLSTLGPEDWASVLNNTLENIKQQTVEKFVDYFSEENMEERYYIEGEAEGVTLGIFFEELLEECLKLKFTGILDPKLLNAADAVENTGDLGRIIKEAVDIEDAAPPISALDDMVPMGEIDKQADVLGEGADTTKKALGNAADAIDEVIEGGSKNIFKAAPELEAHIRNTDPSVPRKRGIGGAHNSTEFFKHDVKIISETPSKIPGVKKVEYKIMPKLNPDGTPTGEYGAKVFKKTIYYPEIISDDEFVKHGLEAANDAIKKSDDGIMPKEWFGVDSKGITWHGYFEDGDITSFFPDE